MKGFKEDYNEFRPTIEVSHCERAICKVWCPVCCRMPFLSSSEVCPKLFCSRAEKKRAEGLSLRVFIIGHILILRALHIRWNLPSLQRMSSFLSASDRIANRNRSAHTDRLSLLHTDCRFDTPLSPSLPLLVDDESHSCASNFRFRLSAECAVCLLCLCSCGSFRFAFSHTHACIIRCADCKRSRICTDETVKH